MRGTAYGRTATTPGEDAFLTHVGFGTPVGELLRRYWQPVALSSELGDLPLKIRILDEELVVFRDTSGRAGLLDAHCCHRGASLEYGRVERDGIRCCYHGWLFDAQGRCLDQPCEPSDGEHSDGNYRESLRQPWYPVREYGGLVFAYMGPPDRMPEFPFWDILLRDGVELRAYRNHTRGVVAECNWLQIHENAVDPMHTFVLHSTNSGNQFTPAFATRPEIDFITTPISVRYVRNATLPNGNRFHRVGEVFVPNARSLPSQTPDGDAVLSEPGRFIGWWVPVDDTHTIGFHIEALPVVDGRPEGSVWAEAVPGLSNSNVPPPQSYQDTQRRPGDREAQVSQRPIAVHALENLATSDLGIVKFRRLVRQAAEAVARGEDPPGICRDPARAIIEVGAKNEILPPDGPTETSDTSLARSDRAENHRGRTP
jgi:nitrite reductase/ring-hydroxylating ferredoxin subunit